MTNKEAIEELKKVDTLDMPARLCEAHYMAIKALEQEPKTDVLDEIKAEIKQLPYQRIFGKVSNYSLIDVVIEIIDKYRAESENEE
jgi:hypothetical protein